jgi:thiamine biosynthesis protein ThiS
VTAGDALTVAVNGEARQVPAGSTISDLLRALALDAVRLAVEHNRRVVPRAEHAATRLHDGDTVEIVTFVGGG